MFLLTPAFSGWDVNAEKNTAQAVVAFKKDDVEFSAQVSAVAITKGVAAKTNFKDGIAVFTMTKGRLMYEASVAGKKLSFEKK